MVNTLKHTTKDIANLWVLNDLHLGARSCKKKQFKKVVEKIRKDKHAVVVLNGDLMEAIHTSDKRFDMDSVDDEFNTVEKQYGGLKKLIEPIEDKIIAVGIGNHERTIKKTSGIDLSNLLAEDLGVLYYGDALMLKLKAKSNNYRCLIMHGNTGATTITGNINAIKKYAENMDQAPDVIIMGHVHRLDVIHNPKLSDEFDVKVKFFAINGSFFGTYKQGENNYGTQQFFPPTITGCIKFIFGEKTIRYEVNY